MNEHESFLPYNLPDISDAEIDAVVETLRSGWLAPGPRVRRFEEEFAAYTGAKHAIALDSATAGMHLALLASGIGPGDEVITTPTTFAATVNVIIHAGATPVLADIGIDDYCIDPTAIERAITPRTKAIMPVHYGGSACRMDEILAIAREAQPARHRGRGARARHVHRRPAHRQLRRRDGVQLLPDQERDERPRRHADDGRRRAGRPLPAAALHGMSNDAWDRYTERGSWAYQVLRGGLQLHDDRLPGGARSRAVQPPRRVPAHGGASSRCAFNERLAALPEIVLPIEREGTTHAGTSTSCGCGRRCLQSPATSSSSR